MSEPRRLNTDAAPHAMGETARTVNTQHSASGGMMNQQEYEAARRRAREAAAGNSRRTRSFSRVQQSDIDRYYAAQSASQGTQNAPGSQSAAPSARTVQTAQSAPRQVRQHPAQSSSQPAASAARPAASAASGAQASGQPLTTAQRQAMELQRRAAASQHSSSTQVRHLDLNETKGARAHYDQNDDPEYQARTAARAANGGAAARSTGAGKSSAKAPGKAPGKSAAGGAGGGKPPKNGSGHSGTSGKGGKNGKGSKGKKKGTWWKVLLGTVAAIVLIFEGTIYLITRSIAPEAGSISINQLINTPKEYSGKEFNVLLVGVDRSSESGTSDAQVNDGLTDMIMYLHFNNETGELKMLQIPRNIFVTTDASYSGNYQINGIAKTQGPSGYNDIGALCEYVSDALQVPIDGYVCIFMEKLTELVDLIGGVQMYVPQVMDYGGSHLDPGYQTLDGAACEFFLRTRHIYSNSDLGRLNMQRYFYAAMFAKLRSMSIWDIAKNLPFYLSMVETSLNVNDLVSVALSLKNVSSEKIMLAQVPVYMGGLVYPFNVENPNSVVVVARQETADLLNQYFRENTGYVDAANLNVRDDVHNLSGYSASDPNVQWMGTLNSEIADAQQNNNIDGSLTTDVYDVPDPAADGQTADDGDASEPAA